MARSESQTMTRSRTRPLSFGDILAAADDPMVVDQQQQQPPPRSTRSTRCGRANAESSSSRADEDSSTDVAHALLSLQQPQQQPPSARRRRTAGAVSSDDDIAPSLLELQHAKTPRAIQGLQTWYLRYNELVKYKDQFGDCNVPQKYPPNSQLGIWVNKQRMEKKFFEDNKRTSMTETKAQHLEMIGFQWAKRKGQISWDIKYNELCAYHREHGHCDVPTKYKKNQALGRWVSTQRYEFKKYVMDRSKHMTEDKIRKLNELQFRWEMLQQNPSPQRVAESSESDTEMSSAETQEDSS